MILNCSTCMHTRKLCIKISNFFSPGKKLPSCDLVVFVDTKLSWKKIIQWLWTVVTYLLKKFEHRIGLDIRPLINDVTTKMPNFRPLSPYVTISHFFSLYPLPPCHPTNSDKHFPWLRTLNMNFTCLVFFFNNIIDYNWTRQKINEKYLTKR